MLNRPTNSKEYAHIFNVIIFFFLINIQATIHTSDSFEALHFIRFTVFIDIQFAIDLL